MLRSAVSFIALVGGLSGVAAAQSPAPADVAQADALDEAAQPSPGEIVVTAQRRSESGQTTALSVSVIGGEELANKSIDNLTDLQTAAPSLTISDGGIFQIVNIRGIGLATNSPNVTPGVSTYIDGLEQPPIATGNAFYDLASVEVLRGPQGTLVGTNSTGGAIYINSQNPKLDTFEGYGQVGYGNYDSFSTEGAINIPVSGALAIRAAGFFRRHDSYFTDVGPLDSDAGSLNEKGGRLSVLFKPGSFQALLKLQYNHRDTGGYAVRPIPGSPFAAYRVGDIRTLSFDAPTGNRDRIFISSLELRQEFAGGTVLRSLSGYQWSRVDNLHDIDASQAPASAGGKLSQDYFAYGNLYTQELNLISPTDGAFDWLLGAYFQRADVRVNFADSANGFPSLTTPNNQRTTTGVFAQGNYELTPSLELQVGARYSWYKTTGSGAVRIGAGIPGFPPGGLQVADLAGSYKDHKLTGKVALNWTVDSDNFLYAFAARGYKPGAFNSAVSTFGKENVDSFELGWKSRLFDRRVNTQISAFYNDYSGYQYPLLVLSSGRAGVQNLASLTTKGVEAQVQGKFGIFGFDANLAYLDSKVPAFTTVNLNALPPGNLGPQCAPGVPSNPPVCFDYGPFTQTIAGGPNVFAAKWTYSLGAHLDLPVGDDATLTPRLNYSYIGPQFTYLAYDPISDRLGGRGLLSAKLTLRKGNWRIEAYGTNIANKKYVLGQFGRNELYGAPREYGVSVGVDF